MDIYIYIYIYICIYTYVIHGSPFSPCDADSIPVPNGCHR